MPVCFLGNNYNTKYDCEYRIDNETLEIDINYDIMDEIPAVSGIKRFGKGTEIESKDILVIDYQAKRNILAKNAMFAGCNNVFGTPDSSSRSKFRTRLYFEHNVAEELANLPQTPKVNKIKVFSKTILRLIGRPSLECLKTNSYTSLKLSKENKGDSIEIKENYIKQISISDDWMYTDDVYEKSITVDFSGYIEIELTKKVDYITILDFIYEFEIFMQLYCPDEFSIDKIHVAINDKYYIFNIPLSQSQRKRKYVEQTVDEELLVFLKKCYTRIPYRKSVSEIRNIPYVILETNRSIEDNFLMFYRFIECFYKKEEPKEKNRFIELGLKNHYKGARDLAPQQLENLAREIICLRNHYVHAGYYIRNKSLKISFERVRGKKNPKDYTVNNVDFHWIYDKTKILYQVVIDIIYKKMLGYETYRFTRHF